MKPRILLTECPETFQPMLFANDGESSELYPIEYLNQVAKLTGSRSWIDERVLSLVLPELFEEAVETFVADQAAEIAASNS